MLHRAWTEPAVRARLQRVFLEGIFRTTPQLGAAFIRRIDELVTKSDEAVYALLYDFLHKEHVAEFRRTFSGDEDQRICRRVEQIVTLVPTPPSSIIDVGCGDGRVTGGLARKWNVPKERAIAVDVFNRVFDHSDITYVPVVDGRIACNDKTADVALLLMVLHHEADPAATLRDVHRVLKPAGQLIIRESDVDTPELKLFNHVMEDFYFQVFRMLPDVPNPARHESAAHWIALLEKLGYVIEKLERPEPDNPFTPIHIVARRKELPS